MQKLIKNKSPFVANSSEKGASSDDNSRMVHSTIRMGEARMIIGTGGGGERKAEIRRNGICRVDCRIIELFAAAVCVCEVRRRIHCVPNSMIII